MTCDVEAFAGRTAAAFTAGAVAIMAAVTAAMINAHCRRFLSRINLHPLSVI
jgi:hypothetical protein